MKTLQIATLLLLLACGKDKIETENAFYYWQTNLELNDLEQQYLDSLKIKKLYVKFFDVDWDNSSKEAVPNAEFIWKSDQWQSFEIIPTVFITNHTLLQISEDKINQLASRIVLKINQLSNGFTFQEVQIDCDWTQSTKEKYFQLLNRIESLLPNRTLSATIRLHQIKYAHQTGIPSVDRGMLMYYNIGEITKWESENSIFQADIAASYLENSKQYQLPLDVVLPIFHWGLVFRDEQLFKIVNNLEAGDLVLEKYQKIAPNRYEVIQDTYLKGHYLYKGDKIRLEDISKSQLTIATKQLTDYLTNQSRTIAFYHLDEAVIKNWEIEVLEDILSSFSD